MKKLLLIAFFFYLSAAVLAQTAQQILTVKGVIIDSVTNKPLGYVTVALLDAKTQVSIKGALSKNDGSFELIGATGKAYQVAFAFMGYTSKVISISGTNADVNIGKVFLSATSNQLREVAVTAVKPLVKQEVDRISYDVQADPESKSVTALDMMRRVPLLSVDASDNIKLRGSGDYKILINGKESALLAKNPSDILKSMPADNIIKIEVITTPPAKYDAEGLAGIINIITKKNAAQGYNGSVNTNYNTVNGYRLNLNATVKQGKIGVSGSIGGSDRRYMGAEFGNQSTFFPSQESLQQKGIKYNGGHNNYASTELSYEADSLNLITGTFDFFNNYNNTGTTQFTTQSNSSDVVTQYYHLLADGNGEFHGSDFGLNYQLGFKNNKGELLTASYKYSYSDNKQFNNVTTDQTFNYPNPDYRQYNNAGSKENTAQLDYIDPLKIVTVEAGAKMILRNNFSKFRDDTLSTAGDYITNENQVDNFTYHQDVYSIYNSYQLKYTNWTFKGGLRLEYTNTNADFLSTGSSINENYSNLVPSLSVQRSLKNSSLTFGFTQRIQRPGINQLNPFVDMSNPNFVTMGNPALRPAVNNNFELNYGNYTKGSINISTSYSFANNSIQSLASVDANNVTTTTFANVGKSKRLGLDVNVSYPITKRLNTNINTEILQVWLAGVYEGSDFTSSGQQGHIFTNTSYKFDDGYRLQLNIGFDSRYVLPQGRDNYYFACSVGASKEILNKKGSIFLGFANPFSKFNRLDFFTKTADFQNYNYNLNYYRALSINFNYKFGRLNSAIKKNQRGINNDDTSNGSKN